MATMGTDFKSNKFKKEEFDNLSVLEKRTYLLQEDQYETMWWSRTANKIFVFIFFIGFVLGIFAVLLNMK